VTFAFRKGSSLAILAFLLIAIWLGALAPRQLAKSDEGRYAEISREMTVTGDWLTPRLDGLKYFEKPALQYWATALADEAFGLSEWSARLWTGLTALFGLAALGLGVYCVYGRTTAIVSVAVLSSSLMYFLMGHVDTLDMGLTAFMTATLAGLLAGLFGVREHPKAMLLAWAAAALAVLSKGLIGIVLPGAIVVIYMCATRNWRILARSRLIAGMALFLVIASPWFIAVSIANPHFAHFFFIHEHVERFLTHEHNRVGPWWYFVPILMAGMLPWLTLSLAAVIATVSNRRSAPSVLAREIAADRFLLLWAGFIFLFFSASGSKLPSYILPVIPALCVLTARTLLSLGLAALVWHARGIALVAALGVALGLVSRDFALHADEIAAYARFGRIVSAGALVVVLGALWAAREFRLGLRQRGVLLLALASILACVLGLCGYAELDRFASAKYVADAINPLLTPDTPIYSVEEYEQTLPFYLRRTMTLVNHRDELDFGINEEPGKWIATLAEFEKAWSRDTRAIAVMPPSTFDKLRVMNLASHVVLADRRFVVIAKP